MLSHLIQIYTVCPLVFEISICYSLDLNFFENLQTKILVPKEKDVQIIRVIYL